jgi:D-glycero-beta-D-manno-heptose 1-phosphate adenylyltransferase
MKSYPQIHVFETAGDVLQFLSALRSSNKTLVTTNGCFDLLHTGHVRYLADAAALGDLLVVGVNADTVVQKLKGTGRPLQKEYDRAALVASLKMVDAAFVFYEDDPRAFLEILKPDIHVKGGDYTKDIIEREIVEKNGGRIEIVPYVKGYSTSSLVSKIRST